MSHRSSSVSQQLRAVAARTAERIVLAIPQRSEARLAAVRLEAHQAWARVRILGRLAGRSRSLG